MEGQDLRDVTGASGWGLVEPQGLTQVIFHMDRRSSYPGEFHKDAFGGYSADFSKFIY
jgi:hypothetical protein